LLNIGSFDNESKGGYFDRRRKLRDERCKRRTDDFLLLRGLASFLNYTIALLVEIFKIADGNLRSGNNSA
jgi:hypothetical protein